MNKVIFNPRILKRCRWGFVITIITLLTACNPVNRQQGAVTLNSRYNDEEPALSGDGRLLAMVSNRNGSSQILLYDLKQEQFINTSSINRPGAIAQSPSLSRTGRYLTYISSAEGRPEIVLYDRVFRRSEIMTQGYRAWVRKPQISADGRYIVFETSRRGGWDIEVLDRGPNIEIDVPDGSPVVNPKL